MRSNSAFRQALDSSDELEIRVTGRKSGRGIGLPVWFVRESDKLYLLPVKGTDTEWYKNVLHTPTLQLSAGGRVATATAHPIADVGKVQEIATKFRAKYGADEVKKYYTKFDAGIEIPL